MYSAKDIADKIKLTGRCVITEDGISFDHTAAEFAFNAYCKGDVSLNMRFFARRFGHVFVSVIVDGITVRVEIKGKSEENISVTLPVAENLPNGRHNFRIIRQTEQRAGDLTLIAMDLDGELLPPPEKKALLIEFIGDSLTCGYGNLGSPDSPGDPFDPVYQDGTQTFAYLTAQSLNADMQTMSVSGIGISCGFYPVLMPEIYDCTFFLRNRDLKYEFPREPQAVVINLGTNDEQKLDEFNISKDEFVDKTAAFLRNIRERHPKSKIVMSYGFVLNELERPIINAVDMLGGEKNGFYYAPISNCGKPAGTCEHPSVSQHERAAKELTSFLKNIL